MLQKFLTDRISVRWLRKRHNVRTRLRGTWFFHPTIRSRSIDLPLGVRYEHIARPLVEIAIVVRVRGLLLRR